ncbi:hypothetical protein D3C74_419960 [compost metagenome]
MIGSFFEFGDHRGVHTNYAYFDTIALNNLICRHVTIAVFFENVTDKRLAFELRRDFLQHIQAKVEFVIPHNPGIIVHLVHGHHHR